MNASPPLFNLTEWNDRIPPTILAQEVEEWKEDPYVHVSSPGHIVGIEKQRLASLEGKSAPKSIETDLFLFGRGAPPRRDLTQIGGLPYRPAGLAWPVVPDGTPLTFIGQMRFSESRDITGKLPGDILLLFVDDVWVSVLHHEWHSFGVEDLISLEEMPTGDWQIPQFWGVRHRTVDYCDSENVFPSRSFASLVGTKIGGLSNRFQFDRDGRYKTDKLPDWVFVENSHIIPNQGAYLGDFCSLMPWPLHPWPWLNVPDPLGWKEHRDSMFCLGDASWLEFYLQNDGRLGWHLCPDIPTFR